MSVRVSDKFVGEDDPSARRRFTEADSTVLGRTGFEI